MKRNNILLTGGAGFIGSHTAVELLQAGYGVVVADNYSNSDPGVLTQIEKITGKSVIRYATDVANRAQLREIFARENIDSVIHFAGFKAVGESVQQPLRYYRNNLDTTLTLLEIMEDFHVKKLVFSSSATVYGVPETVPLTETATTSCSNPYGWTKWMNEQILRDACAADSELSVVLLRYFNPVGAHESGLIGEKPKGTPTNLMPYITGVAAGALDRLKVFGGDYPTPDGTGVRDYIHVVDLAQGHLAALKYADSHSGVEVFNLGTGHGYSVLEMVKTFEKANGVAVPYEITARRPGDVAECYADPQKAERILNWRAEKDLTAMCADAWRWQKNSMGGA